MILNSTVLSLGTGISTDGADTVYDAVAAGDFGNATKVGNDLMAVRNASILNLGTIMAYVSLDGITYFPVPPSTERVFLSLPTITQVKVRDRSAGSVSSLFITLWG